MAGRRGVRAHVISSASPPCTMAWLHSPKPPFLCCLTMGCLSCWPPAVRGSEHCGYKDVTIAYPWVVGVLGGLGSGLWVPTVLRPHLVSRLS